MSGHSSAGHGSAEHRSTGHGAGHANLPAKASASTTAFEDVNAKMHEAMAIQFTGNADREFVAGMIPHHQRAVDMAKIVLEHGKDASVRKLAKDIIKSQEQEIAWMRSWLAKHEKAAKKH